MAKLSKRMRAIAEQVDSLKPYAAAEAFGVLGGLPQTKFIQSIDVAINLGVDPRKSDQVVRGSVVLPNGTGKAVKVAVFTQGAQAEAAQAAGADHVGMDDLAEGLKSGSISVDVVIATPDAMGVVGRLGPILGPRGLMPNPKDGTVSKDAAQAVQQAKAGQVRFRTDKNGIIHCSIGKMNFEGSALCENLESLVSALKKLKPSSAKGVYLRKIMVSSTMGPALLVDASSLSGAV